MKSHTVLLALLAWYAAQGLRNCRASVCLSVRPIIWPLQQVCCCGPGDAWRKVLGVIDTGNTVSSNNCLVLHPVVQKHSLQTSCLSPCKTNDRICPVSLLTKLSPRGGAWAARRYTRRRWQFDSRRIYVRQRTGPQCSHLWWRPAAGSQRADSLGNCTTQPVCYSLGWDSWWSVPCCKTAYHYELENVKM